MEPLDALYRHEGHLIWDADGVTATRAANDLGATTRWDQITGARQVGVGPGYVQLLVTATNRRSSTAMTALPCWSTVTTTLSGW